MLQADGIENFKRSVSQNYFNWLVSSRKDPQFKRVLKSWRQFPSIWPFLTRIEKEVKLRLTLNREPIVLSAGKRQRYRLFVSLLWEMMLRSDKAGLAKLVSEPEIGNPIRIRRNGELISQDMANSILECNILNNLLAEQQTPPKVAEIGAGSGRLAHVYAATQRGTYHIFDIPPALHISQWYLTKVLPDKKIFTFRRFEDFESIREELESADIAFFSANQIRKFPAEYFDAIVTICTLPELAPEQAKLYLSLFQKLARKFIFIKQWKDWHNPLDGTYIAPDDYILDDAWEVIMNSEDPVVPYFFNRVWRRRA